MRMLIAEDDSAVGNFIARGFERDGYEVRLATDGAMAIEMVRQEPPELAVLDLNLPRYDGTRVLEFLRSVTEDAPVLILTARSETETRLQCLEMGADDFMLKPFAFAELRARCRALTRRRSPGLLLRYGDLELNRVERTVACMGQPVVLTNREYGLLECLMLHRGRAVSRASLLDRVWNTRPDVATNVVDVYVNYLRRKLGNAARRSSDTPEQGTPEGEFIQTVRGFGYSIGLRQ